MLNQGKKDTVSLFNASLSAQKAKNYSKVVKLNRRMIDEKMANAGTYQYLYNAQVNMQDTVNAFTTLQEGLKQLGVLNDLKLALAPMPTAGEFSLELRVQLDIEALPAPLRPVAYTSLSWRLNSGWSTWKLAP